MRKSCFGWFKLLVAILSLGGRVRAEGTNADAETEMTGELVVVQACDFANQRTEVFHFLRDQDRDRMVRLRFAQDSVPRGLRTGSRVRVRGHEAAAELTLAANDAGIQTLEVASAAVSGEQKTIVIVINFSNAANECAPAAVNNLMFAGSQTVDGLYQDTSFGNVWFTGNVVGPFTINFTSGGSCDYNNWATAADALAQAAGVNLNAYTHRVYVLPKTNPCGWAGLGTIGGNPSRAWIGICDIADIYAHELGHNLGMHHASTDANNDDVSDCEYCDNSDFMGYGGVGLRQVNAPHKEQMGWLPANKVQLVNGAGTFNVAPEEVSPANTTYVQTLKIARPSSSEYYYFSYRRALGYDVNLQSQYRDRLSVQHYKGSGAVQTFLISALGDGGTFTDPATGLTVMQLSHNNDFSSVQVSFGCTPAAPGLSISPSGQSVAPGTAANYAVTVQNNDSASCASTTFLLTPSVPSGWSGSVSPSSVALTSGQSANITLTVTSPSATPSGSYPVSVAISDSFNATHNGSANTTYSISSSPPPPPPPPPPPTIGPAAPKNLQAVSMTRRIRLTWTRSTGSIPAKRYLIWRNGVNIGRTSGAGYTDRAIVAGTSYSYYVTATDAAGNQSPPSSTATVTALMGRVAAK